MRKAKIKILGNVKVKGKKTPLLNYQYVDRDDFPISAIFQGTIEKIKEMGNII